MMKMQIEGRDVLPELENEIRPLYEKTFNSILDLIDKAEEFKLDRPIQEGDCFASILRLGNEDSIISLGLCTRIEPYSGYPGYSEISIIKKIEIRRSGYYIDIEGKNSFYDCWFIDKQNWLKTEKLLQLVKTAYLAMVEQKS